MKRAICLLVCLASLPGLFGCARYEIEKGMWYFGQLPSMNLGIQTNEVTFAPDAVSLELCYGWHAGFTSEVGMEGFEPWAVVLLVYGGDAYTHLWAAGELADFTDLDSVCPDTFHILKVIDEGLDDPRYVCEISKYGKATYGTRERFSIPSAVFADEQGKFEIAIAFVARNCETGAYRYAYMERMPLHFTVPADGRIELRE